MCAHYGYRPDGSILPDWRPPAGARDELDSGEFANSAAASAQPASAQGGNELRGGRRTAEMAVREEVGEVLPRDSKRRVQLLEEVQLAKEDAAAWRAEAEARSAENDELKADLTACLKRLSSLQSELDSISVENARQRREATGRSSRHGDVDTPARASSRSFSPAHAEQQQQQQQQHIAPPATPPVRPNGRANLEGEEQPPQCGLNSEDSFFGDIFHQGPVPRAVDYDDHFKTAKTLVDTSRDSPRRIETGEQGEEEGRGGEGPVHQQANQIGEEDGRPVYQRANQVPSKGSLHVVSGLEDAHRRMVEARSKLELLQNVGGSGYPAQESADTASETQQAQVRMQMVESEREEMERLMVRDRQEIGELRQAIMGLQAKGGAIAIENERLKAQLEDADRKYQSLLSTAAGSRSKDLDAARSGVDGIGGGAPRLGAAAWPRALGKCHEQEWVAEEILVGESEHVQAAFAGMRKQLILLHAEKQHELSQRVGACSLLSKILAQAEGVLTLHGHSAAFQGDTAKGQVSKGQGVDNIKAYLRRALVEEASAAGGGGGGGGGGGENVAEKASCPSRSASDEWYLSVENIDKVVRLMDAQQLMQASEIVRRSLVDATKMRDEWRQDMWRVSCAQLKRFHSWELLLQEETLSLREQARQLSEERELIAAFHVSMGPLLQNHRMMQENHLKDLEEVATHAHAAQLKILEDSLRSSFSEYQDARGAPQMKRTSSAQLLAAHQKPPPQNADTPPPPPTAFTSTRVPHHPHAQAGRQMQAAHRLGAISEHATASQEATPMQPNTSFSTASLGAGAEDNAGGRIGNGGRAEEGGAPAGRTRKHARRETPLGWSPFECECGVGFGTEKALRAHLRCHQSASQSSAVGDRAAATNGEQARLVDTIVAAYSSPSSEVTIL